MYKLNELHRSVLITPHEVIFHASTAQTLDPRTIEQAIIIAEERFARPALGHALYEVLIAEKNLLITSGNIAANQTLFDDAGEEITLEEGDIANASEYMSVSGRLLWNTILWKYVAECVMIIAAPENYVHFTSDGLVHKVAPAGPMSSTGVVAPDLKTVKWFMDKKMMDRIDPLAQALHVFLCRYKDDDYPDYDKDCDCDEKGTSYRRKSDIILGIYDTEDGLLPSDNCCDW